MDLSNTYRLALIGLLPVIAFLIYYEGQTYDPALIHFASQQPEGQALTSLMPGEIDGYHRAGQVRSYTRENLYEYVNGHAEYFISAGFTGLSVGEYGKGGTETAEPEVVVDIYDMGKSIQAFGVLSDESGGNIMDLQNGLQGFRSPQGVSFVKGRYYVKIAMYSDSIPVDSFVEGIAGAMGAESDPFPEFGVLPDIGEVVATRFIREAYRGLDFVNNVLEREYVVDGDSVQVFVVTGERKKIDGLAAQFIDYFRASDIRYSVSEEKDKQTYRIEDPYEGDWVMISSPDALFGIFGGFDNEIINMILNKDN